MNALASLGIILLFALLAGHLVKFVRVPEVTGYILAGIVVGPSMLGWISHENLVSLLQQAVPVLWCRIFAARIPRRMQQCSSDSRVAGRNSSSTLSSPSVRVPTPLPMASHINRSL